MQTYSVSFNHFGVWKVVRDGICRAGRNNAERALSAPAPRTAKKQDYCEGLSLSFKHISTADVGSMALPPSTMC